MKFSECAQVYLPLKSLCIIRNVSIYFRIISLLVKDIKSPLFIVLIPFSQYESVLSQKHILSLMSLSFLSLTILNKSY